VVKGALWQQAQTRQRCGRYAMGSAVAAPRLWMSDYLPNITRTALCLNQNQSRKISTINTLPGKHIKGDHVGVLHITAMEAADTAIQAIVGSSESKSDCKMQKCVTLQCRRQEHMNEFFNYRRCGGIGMTLWSITSPNSRISLRVCMHDILEHMNSASA